MLKRIDGVLEYVNETLKMINQEAEHHRHDSGFKKNLVTQTKVSLSSDSIRVISRESIRSTKEILGDIK